MSEIVWDKVGERYVETGVDHGVLYPQDSKGKYTNGVAWNGLTNVNESPSGAEASDLYADNIKYATLRSAETFGLTIEAYTSPEEFKACDGSANIAKGVVIGQQHRNPFGLSYRTLVENDTATEEDDAYKLHLVYGATASPSERSYATVNDSPEAITFSWEVTTTPVDVPGYKPASTITVESDKADKTKLAALEKILYGSEDAEPRLPLPEEIIELFGDTSEISG
jgi:hypothetical protein